MPVMDQMTNIPYFTLRDGLSSTLTLQNLAQTPTKVTVTIFNSDGQSHVLDPISLDPHSFREVQLADVAPNGFDSGNIAVAYNGTMMMVTCQVSVFSTEKRVSFESREADMMDFESANLAGILSLPRGADGFLAVTNVATNRVTVQLTAGSLKKAVSLFPRETRLIKLNEDELATPTLVRLQHNGLPGDVITTGYVLDMRDGYSSGITISDPGIAQSSTLAGAHFRAGLADPSEGFPEGTRFRSPLLLANVGAAPATAHVSVDYTVRENVRMTPIDPNDADATEDKFKKTVAVKTLTIAPGDVQRIELSEALEGVGQIAEAGVDIAYDAAPGSLIGQLTSVDQSGDYAFEVPVKDPDAMNAMMESIYPWTVENGTLTVLHLKNTTNKTVEAGVLIRFDGGIYDPDKFELQPYQTIDLDIKRLKDSKKPDVLGHVFPSSATHGQLEWFQITPNTMIGRAEGTDVEAGIDRSFSCYSDCCGNFSQSYNLLPYPMVGLVGGSAGFSAAETYEDCYANVYFYQNQQSSATSWTSNTQSVATVNNGGGVAFVGPGTAYVTAIFPIEYYNYNSRGACRESSSTYTTTGAVYANPPDHLVVVQDLTSQKAGCPATVTPPFVRQLALNAVDVNGRPTIGVHVQETQPSYISVTTNTCGNGQPKPTQCKPTDSGTAEFVDNITVGTCNVPTSPLSCGYNIQYEWQWCDGTASNIGLLTDIVHSNQITINNNASPLTPGGTNVQSIPPGTIIRP